MKPTRDEDAVVDLLDVLLRDGVIVEADVVVTVADVPLVGISLRAAIAGMTTMTEYGMFEDWEQEIRAAAADRSGPERRPIRGRSDRVARHRGPWERRSRNRESE